MYLIEICDHSVVTEMKTCVIDCGLTGLATAATLAELGHRVRLVGDDEIVLSALSRGDIRTSEPELPSIFSNGMRTRKIALSNDLREAVKSSDIIFVALEIFTLRTGALGLTRLKKTVAELGAILPKGKTIVIRSPVLPGTTEEILVPLIEEESGLEIGRGFEIAMTPPMMRIGRVIENSLRPKRLIVGAGKKTGKEVLALFSKIKAEKTITSIRTAEMTELISSCLEATLISYANEMANICERFSVDAAEVIEISDLRSPFERERLGLGLGFGGPYLPRDLSAIIAASESQKYRPDLLRAVRKVNDRQPLVAVRMLEEELGNLRGKRVAILGLASQAGSGEIAETRAFGIAVELLARGAKVVGYDPLASSAFIDMLPGISYASSATEALLKADACIIQTDDKEFARLEKEEFDLMKTKVVIDGRRIVSPNRLRRCGVRVRAIGLGTGERERS